MHVKEPTAPGYYWVRRQSGAWHIVCLAQVGRAAEWYSMGNDENFSWTELKVVQVEGPLPEPLTLEPT